MLKKKNDVLVDNMQTIVKHTQFFPITQNACEANVLVGVFYFRTVNTRIVYRMIGQHEVHKIITCEIEILSLKILSTSVPSNLCLYVPVSI